MESNNTCKKINKRTVAAVLIATVCFAIIALSAGIAGHTTYLKDCEARILNYATDFKATTPQTLTYFYKDGTKEIDLKKIAVVSDGATLSVEKIQDENTKVTKAESTVIDLTAHSQRLAVCRVVSKNGVGKTDYRITLAPASAESNVIDFNVSDATIDLDNVTLNYSGEYDVILPTPAKTYTSAATGNTYNYSFLGWYTTPDYEEGSKINVIEKGSAGGISVYAKFADRAEAAVNKDGYTYVTFGNYPQSQVTEYALYSAIKKSDAFKNAGNNSYFNYNGTTYYKFLPNNVPNLSANGYSSSSTYIFKVEPIEWRVLAKKDVTPSGRVTLLATNILNCAAYSTNDETLLKILYNTLSQNKLTQSIFNLDNFMKSFFDGDSAYGQDGGDSTILKLVKLQIDANYLRTTMNGMVDTMFNGTEKAKISARSFTRYDWQGKTSSYSCTIWPLNYSEAINENYGFNKDYRENDPLRKALVTDFAAANGVYKSQNLAHRGQGSWWLRGAGGEQGKATGNTTEGYGYKDKRIAYVKYTGYVHAYGSLNNNIRSGIRPALYVDYDSVK